MARRHREDRERPVVPTPYTGPGGDPSMQRVQLEAIRRGGRFSFRDPWDRGTGRMLWVAGSGVLFVSLCAGFTALSYSVWNLGKSKAHRNLLHLIFGSAFEAFLATLFVAAVVLVVRRVRDDRAMHRQVLEASRQQTGRWRDRPTSSG